MEQAKSANFASWHAMMVALGVVFLGGGLGASLRYGLLRLAAMLGLESSWAILCINLLGSFALGLLLGALWGRLDLNSEWRLFLITGVLSGFTTFATLAADVVRLSERGNSLALMYLVLSISGGLLLMVLGMKWGKGF